jgi:hypothetical protein
MYLHGREMLSLQINNLSMHFVLPGNASAKIAIGFYPLFSIGLAYYQREYTPLVHVHIITEVSANTIQVVPGIFSFPGIAVARQANINRIAVTTTNPPEALSGADLVVKTLAHLSIEQAFSLF